MSVDTRRRMAFGLVSARQPTSRWRPYPNLLIIGAQRCGTSSLFKYLGAHPLCRPSARKEIRYFTEYYSKDPGWYRAHFPLSGSHEDGKAKVNFEATPDYLLDPRVPERAADLLGQFRVVVLLRDPVKRAYSHYWHNRRLGTEWLSFEDALAEEGTRIAPYLREWGDHPKLPTPKSYLRYSYVERGRYATQLERWMHVVDPDRILVVRSEQLFKSTDSVYQGILRFLSLPEWRPKTYRNFSYDSVKPKHPPMNPDTHRWLEGELSQETERLQDLLSRVRSLADLKVQEAPK